METDNKVVAVAMERVNIASDRVILMPIKPIVGTLLADEDTIVTSDNEKYLGAYTVITSETSEKQCYYANVPLYELVNKYEYKNEKDAVKGYFAEICSALHVGKICEDGSFEVVDVAIEELDNFANECVAMTHEGNKSNIELSLSDINSILKLQTLEEVRDCLIAYQKCLIAFGNACSDKNNFAMEDTDDEKQERSLVVVKEDAPKTYRGSINVGALYYSVTASVKAQDEPVEDIVTTIATNYMSEDNRNRSHILLTGPTGVGKTEIIECISRYINVPMAKYDMTQVSVTGYVGKSVEDILVRLYLEAKGDIELAQRGILALDEIDKKASDKNDDVSGRGVLNSLLKLLDGTVFDLELERGSKKIPFDTSNLTVVGLGAFSDMDKYKEKPMGFGAEFNSPKTNEMRIEDYVKYGMPAEFMGRFTTLIKLNSLSVEDLKNILLTSNISPLLVKKQFLREQGIKLHYTDAYIDAVARRAIELKTGARSLKATVEYSLKKAEFALLKNNFYNEVILDDETVSNNKAYVLK